LKILSEAIPSSGTMTDERERRRREKGWWTVGGGKKEGRDRDPIEVELEGSREG